MKMTQLEIVQAILDKKSLDYLNKDGVWEGWCTNGGWDHEHTPPTLLFSTLALLIHYTGGEFRIRPTAVIYETRDFRVLIDSGRKWHTHTWTTAHGVSQSEQENIYGPANKFHWLEETHTKEYEVPV